MQLARHTCRRFSARPTPPSSILPSHFDGAINNPCGLHISDTLVGRPLMERVVELGAQRHMITKLHPELANLKDQKILSDLHREILRALFRLLADDNDFLHRAASHALKFEVTHASLPNLLDTLTETTSPRVQTTILDTFCRMGERGQVVEPEVRARTGQIVYHLLDSKDWQVRLFAVRCATALHLAFLDRELRTKIAHMVSHDKNSQVAAAASVTVDRDHSSPWRSIELRRAREAIGRGWSHGLPLPPSPEVPKSSRGYPTSYVNLSRDQRPLTHRRSN